MDIVILKRSYLKRENICMSLEINMFVILKMFYFVCMFVNLVILRFLYLYMLKVMLGNIF